MLPKLENTRMKSSYSKLGRLAAGTVLGASILAGSVMAVNGAPQFNGTGRLTLHDRATAGQSGLQDIQAIGWRRGGELHTLSDEEIEERVTRVVRHVAIEIDATPEQIKEIVAILTPAAIDMKAVRLQFSSAGEDLHELILADQVDRAAVEALRAEKLALADEVSKKLTEVMIEVAEVLTPDQRAMLDEKIEAFRGRRFGFGRH